MKKKKAGSTKKVSSSQVYCDTRFEGYEGKNRFEVRHVAHPPCVVASPDEASAIVAAAAYNGMRWTDYSYYAYAEVSKAVQATKGDK